MRRDLAILVPVLRRPHRVAPLLASARAATPKARVLFITSSADFAEHGAIADAGVEMLVYDGNYGMKINAGVAHTREPFVLTGADDIHFHPGWFDAARALMSDTIGVVGTNDLCSARVRAGLHSTHTLVARWYIDQLGTIDEPGKLLHEAYPHEFSDDELIATARHRGAYAHAHNAVIEHLHPDAAKAPMDDLYAARPPRMRAGRRIFRRREHLWT